MINAFLIKLLTISAPVLYKKNHSQSNSSQKNATKNFLLMKKLKIPEVPNSGLMGFRGTLIGQETKIPVESRVVKLVN